MVVWIVALFLSTYSTTECMHMLHSSFNLDFTYSQGNEGPLTSLIVINIISNCNPYINHVLNALVELLTIGANIFGLCKLLCFLKGILLHQTTTICTKTAICTKSVGNSINVPIRL